MRHEKVEPQKNPETGEFIGYQHFASNGAPITMLGVVEGCDCEDCVKRRDDIEEQGFYEGTHNRPNPRA